MNHQVVGVQRSDCSTLNRCWSVCLGGEFEIGHGRLANIGLLTLWFLVPGCRGVVDPDCPSVVVARLNRQLIYRPPFIVSEIRGFCGLRALGYSCSHSCRSRC